MNKNGKKNLILFEKGKSGNPNGRPKGAISLKTRMAKIMESTASAELIAQFKSLNLPKTSRQNIDAIIGVLVINALQGDTAATKLLLEYYAGKPEQPISGVEDKPLEIVFRRIDKKPSED